MERVMEQSVEEKEEVKGTSREPGALAGVYEVLSQRAIDEAIRIGVEDSNTAIMKAVLPELLRNPNSMKTLIELSELGNKKK